MFLSNAGLKRTIPELLAVFFNSLSNMVGVSGEERLKRHVFACGREIDLADYMADRLTNVRFRASFCAVTAHRGIACDEASLRESSTTVSAFAQLDTVRTYHHRRATSAVYTGLRYIQKSQTSST